jgi:predicted murein hydrolase (TIGR00659 family)
MNSFIENSVFWGSILTLFTYLIGCLIKQKFHSPLANPLLISVILIIVYLVVFNIDYETYRIGSQYISYFLTPATVCLAIPLYRQFALLKKHWKAVVSGILTGVIVSMSSILLMSILFGLTKNLYISILSKSITTAIAIGITAEYGGTATITAAAICVTGVFGSIISGVVMKVFRIKNPLSVGLALGTASHAMGTSKALEIGEVEGAMSGLSIAVAGLFTVVLAPFFANTALI